MIQVDSSYNRRRYSYQNNLYPIDGHRIEFFYTAVKIFPIRDLDDNKQNYIAASVQNLNVSCK